MPGFFLSNVAESYTLVNQTKRKCIKEELAIPGWVTQRNTLDKFLNDKAFFQDAEGVVIAEGVVLNLQELFDFYRENDMPSLVRAMRKKEGDTFFRKFRGSFSGALYDSMSRTWLVWTNHYGENLVFYSQVGSSLFIGSQFNYVSDALQSHAHSVSLNEKAVLCMLTYASMDEGITYANEIQRLEPGHYLKIDDQGVQNLVYWELQRDLVDLSSRTKIEMIEGYDDLFRAAVKREYSKDTEYGYRHIAELSGGLDSRMVSWVAADLGFSDAVNVNFCQSGYLDELIAKQIACDLRNELLLEPMDDASFLFDIDQRVSENYGLTLYSGMTGGVRLYNNIDMESFGLIHTGALGDVAPGSFLKSEEDLNKSGSGGLYSQILKQKVDEICSRAKYKDYEMYLMNVRGFFCAITSNAFRREQSETSSPFLDIDVLEYAMSIPLEYRIGHGFYRDWVKSKYPKAASYIWEKEGVPLTAGNLSRFLSKVKTRGRIPERVIHKLKIVFGADNAGLPIVGGMNPMDKWCSERPEILDYFQCYYKKAIIHPSISDQIKEDLDRVFAGTVIEKTLVLTVLSAINTYFEK